MSRADIMAGRAYVSLYTKQDAFTRGLQSARADLNKFGSDMLSVGAKVAGIGGLMAAPIAASVKVAANFEEAISKFGFVFKGAKDSAKEWADGFAKQVGRSRLQIVEFMANSQALVMPIGFKDDQAVQMSKQLTQLAVDMASFNNMADADVLRDLHAALVGSSETMLKYGVIANEAAVKQELLNMAIKPDEATNQDKVLARYNLILRGTVAAQGDATRTANSLTNMMKAFHGSLSDVAVEVGTAVIPAFSRIAKSFVDIIRPMAEMARKNPELVMTFVAVAGAVAATGAAIMGAGVAARIAASAMSVASVIYKTAAIAASAAWAAVGLAFAVITIKAKISAAVASTAWSVASSVIAGSWKALGTVLSASISTAVLVASATVIAAAWLAAAGAISVAIFGLGTVLTTTATVATAAWSAAGGFVTAAWLATAGTIGAAWTAVSGTVAALAGVAMGAWLSGAGIAGTAMAVLGAAFAGAGGTGAVSAAITGAAWSAAGAAASLAWSAFTAVLGTVLTASNLLVFAAFAVKTAWAAAWMVISGPILPFIAAAGVMAAVVGAIAASAAYATVKAMDFSEAWSVAKDTLFEIIGIAKQVGGVLMTALQQGDYDIAFKAAMAGIKLVLASAIESMSKMWSLFWDGAWKAAKVFMTNLAAKTQAILSALSQAFTNPVAAGAKLRFALNDIAKNTNLSFGIDTKGMAAAARTELDKLEKELAARQAERDRKSKEDAAKNPPAGDPAAPGGNAPGGSPADAAAEEDAAKKAEQAASAFERETEALEAQIIALREGEEAAERFRLAKQGLSEEQINSVMGMKAEQKALEAQKQAEQDAIDKKQEASQRLVDQVRDIADADYEKSNKLTDAEEKKKKDGTLTAAESAAIKQRKQTPAQIAMKEKAAIERGRQRGMIDDKTAAEATAQADIRQAEKEHQERLKKFRGEGDAVTGTGKDVASVGLKMGGASAATFSAQSLLSMGNSTGQGPQLRAMIATQKAIEMQTKQAQDNADAVVAAVKQSKMKHT